MFAPKGQGPQSPSGAGASPEAVRFAVITAYLRDLNSPANAVMIPIMQSVVTGIQIFLLIGALGLVIKYPKVILTWMFLVMMITIIAMWGLFLKTRTRTIQALENRYHIDLDGDGKIGSKPKPREIVSKMQSEDGKHTHYAYWELPEEVVREAALIIQRNGYLVNQHSLCGSGRPLVKPGSAVTGTSSWEVFIRCLLDPANGWANYRDDQNPRRGIDLTEAGKQQIDLICQDEAHE